MKNKNVLLIGGLVALIALAAVLGVVFSRSAALPGADAPALDAALLTWTPAGEAHAAAPAGATEGAAGETAYLVVKIGSVAYQAIPLEQEGYYTIDQPDTGAQNVVHVTRDSVSMHSSTCENRDCVLQGTVTLENKDTRILGSQIICLPNQVTLDLRTADELDSLLTLE